MSKIDRNYFDPSFFEGIAHRGYHDENKTENGLPAFQNAIDNSIAFELDIHLTKDGNLVVCHDSDLIRTTGKQGIIEELSLKEIKEGYRLLDGSEVPTLQEVLELNKEKCLIVVELKPYKNNNKPLAKATRKALSQIKNEKKISVISFDPRALLFFGKGRFTRGLLLDISRTEIFAFAKFFDYIDVGMELIHHRKTKKLRKKGKFLNVWTVQTSQDLEYVKGNVDTITFQHLPADKIKETLK